MFGILVSYLAKAGRSESDFDLVTGGWSMSENSDSTPIFAVNSAAVVDLKMKGYHPSKLNYRRCEIVHNDDVERMNDN